MDAPAAGGALVSARRCRALGLTLVLVASGCHSRGAPPVLQPAADPACLGPAGAPADTLTVAIEGSLSAAPDFLDPVTDADRFVAAQLRGGVRPVPCLGRLRADSAWFRLAARAGARVVLHAGGSLDRPRVIVVEATGTRDLRDLLDRPGAAPVVVARDPRVAGYASQRGLVSRPLGWDRVYRLVGSAAVLTGVEPSAEDIRQLAELAIRGDVRGAPSAGGLRVGDCPAGQGGVVPRPVVGYPANDAVARDLAERIVALAGTAAPPPWLTPRGPDRLTALPLSPEALDSAVAAGSVAAAIVTGRPAGGRCAGPAGSRVLDLIESRATVTVGPGAPLLLVDPDGLLRVIPSTP